MITYEYDGFVFNDKFYPFDKVCSISGIKLIKKVGFKECVTLSFEIDTLKEKLIVQSKELRDVFLYDEYEERHKYNPMITIKDIIMECESYQNWFLNFEDVRTEFFKNYSEVKIKGVSK